MTAMRQASHAAASSSTAVSTRPANEFSLPQYATASAGTFSSNFLQQPPTGADFDRILTQAHETYRNGDFHRALQLCQAVRKCPC